jgi:hypothetical protein
MADVPPEMMQGERLPDQEFLDEELLFRRFSFENLRDGEISPAAFELPDMSVNRGKYAKPDHLLVSEQNKEFGVASFRVEDVPVNDAVWHSTVKYLLQVFHEPHRKNYAHCEIRVFRDGTRITTAANNLNFLDPDFHLRWRERLAFCCDIRIYPGSE